MTVLDNIMIAPRMVKGMKMMRFYRLQSDYLIKLAYGKAGYVSIPFYPGGQQQRGHCSCISDESRNHALLTNQHLLLTQS